MRKFALALLLLPAVVMNAANKPNQADFPLKVHVISSESTVSGGFPHQVLEAMIDGKEVRLTGYSAGVLTIADYPARISKDVHGPYHPNTYDIYLGYDFLMPDGSTRTYTVTRLGLAAPPNP